jgi:hypothetical protein
MKWQGPIEPHFETEEPIVRFLRDGRNCVLMSEIRFVDSFGVTWIAEAGKRTDGASIPRPLWALIGGPYEGCHRDGALLHDDAYSEAPADETGYWTADLSERRRMADRMLWEAAIVGGSPRWTAFLIHQGVRLGGAFAWRSHARSNAELMRRVRAVLNVKP